ncbi:MAG: DUF6240 domain-containing protein [Lachnospiraceae bacterium]|nr:DUF6240 domain-containing protein [Lachnospiraceae bacterium]
MNIQNAFAAYGVNNNHDTKPASNLDEALSKIGQEKTSKTSSSSKSAFSSIEASFGAAEETLDSAQTSELYSKNLGSEQNVSSSEDDNKTEAEKDQERLEDSSDRMSASDMEQLINEGYDVFGMTTEELSAAVDRLKLQKEMFAEAIEGQIEAKIDNREAVIAMAIRALGGNPDAEKIADKLMRANLPVTEANLRRVAIALEMSGNERTVSGAEAEYLIRNKMTPTLENIAEARSASAVAKKEKTLSEAAWNQLQPTVSHLLFQAGLRQGRDMMEAAQDFIRKDIPLTADNLKAYAQLTKIKLTKDEILTRAVDAISIGQEPKSANLLSSTAKQVRQIIKNNDTVTDAGIDYAVAKKAAQTGEYSADKLELSLGELHEAQEEVNSNAVVPTYLEEYGNSGMGNAASIKARRQLEEVKAKMTYEAGYRLAKEGIRIDSVSMNKLLNNLRALENRYYSDFFKQSGAAPGSYTQNDVDLLKDTTRRLKEIENMPASLVYDTVDKAENITIDELFEEGRGTYSHVMGKFNNTFETVMTSPSAKYGDNIEKAFANVDKLIENAGLPVTEASRRATRILGYAAADITADNINKVAEYDAKLQDAFTNLTPAVTVRMIREGINPLNEALDDLVTKAAEFKAETGMSQEDSYANFLVNLDKKSDLKPEERDAYLAIYRALHQIQESEDSALGSVFRTGSEPTLQSLLTAVRSGKASGHETIINDTFVNLSKVSGDVDRIENKIRAGLSKPSSPEGIMLNKLVESADNTLKELSEDVHYTADEWLKNLNELAASGQNATRFLEDFNILTNIENIDAAKDLLNEDTTIFKNWKRFKTLATGEEGVLPDFLESFNSEEEIGEAFSAFTEESKEIKKEIQHDPSMSRLDVKALKKMDVGIKFMNRLSKRKFYSIPVDTGNEIVSMKVTIVDDAENQTSRVYASVPTENLGTVSAEATIENNKMKCFISSTTAQGMGVLKDRQLNLFAELARNGIQIGSIYYGAEEVPSDRYDYKTSGLYKDIPEGTDTGSPSNELYRIAKVFVTHVRQADTM